MTILFGVFFVMSMPLVYFAWKLFKPKKEGSSPPAAAVEGMVIDEEKPAEVDIESISTLAPQSENQSEPSVTGDLEDDSNSNHSILKAVTR